MVPFVGELVVQMRPAYERKIYCAACVLLFSPRGSRQKIIGGEAPDSMVTWKPSKKELPLKNRSVWGGRGCVHVERFSEPLLLGFRLFLQRLGRVLVSCRGT